jgi:hypothetical protein
MLRSQLLDKWRNRYLKAEAGAQLRRNAERSEIVRV